jgi:hyperosmotically inducible protein
MFKTVFRKLQTPTIVFVLSIAGALAIAASQVPAQQTDAPARIAREIRHELLMLPNYGIFDNLAYRVDGATVTLLGQVAQPTLKSDAGNVLKSIEGVQTVNNEIEVLPLSPNDDRIRLAEYRAIYSQATLNRYALQAVPPIHIIVKNGHVTLEGMVANESDKNVAGLMANGVVGVFSVTNNLRIDR